MSCPVKEQKPPPDLKRPWNAIALRASLVEVRLRDLRHTARPCENVRLWHLRPPRFVECQLRAQKRSSGGRTAGAAGSGPAIPVLIKNLILALGDSMADPGEARTNECFKPYWPLNRVSAQARRPAATPQSDCARQQRPCPQYRRPYHDRPRCGSPASRP